MDALTISAPQVVSLEATKESMELAKSQLEAFTHTLAELLSQFGTSFCFLVIFCCLYTHFPVHCPVLSSFSLPLLTFS